MPSTAAGLSTHPDPAVATGEAVGSVVERIGAGVDLAVVFVSGSTIAALDDVLDAVHQLLRPTIIIGCTAAGVLGGSEEVESGAGLSIWGGRLPDAMDVASLRPIEINATDMLLGLPSLSEDDAVLLLADPFTFPVDQLLAELEIAAPGVPVIGGLASAGRAPEHNRLFVGAPGQLAIRTAGAVGLVLPASLLQLTVSQGCRPIGEPWVVTKGAGNLITELAGKPALERLTSMIEELSPEERMLASQGLHCGFVARETRDDFNTGDFLIRGVLGADRSTGVVAVGATVEVGDVVQFQVRDAASATAELSRLLPDQADGAIVFTCNGRGSHLFEVPSHDAAMIAEVAGGGVAGMFCAGELGPVGAMNAMHGFTASVLWWR